MAKVMNPVVLIDEVDKISKTEHGEAGWKFNSYD
jgi:ATP-dependent Lon protease